ncbi:UNVERIFIED_CONTAM: hypothetical protein H355_013783, partial [Colinus virginianus]
KYLRQPSYISIGDPGAGKRSIEQRIEFVPEARKKQRLQEGSHDVLVATDVAGRGIDVEGVQLVVNFDMPKDIEAYTHRIEEDSGLFYDLRQLLVSTNNIVPLELSQHPASKQKGGDKNLSKPIWFN